MAERRRCFFGSKVHTGDGSFAMLHVRSVRNNGPVTDLYLFRCSAHVRLTLRCVFMASQKVFYGFFRELNALQLESTINAAEYVFGWNMGVVFPPSHAAFYSFIYLVFYFFYPIPRSSTMILDCLINGNQIPYFTIANCEMEIARTIWQKFKYSTIADWRVIKLCRIVKSPIFLLKAVYPQETARFNYNYGKCTFLSM